MKAMILRDKNNTPKGYADLLKHNLNWIAKDRDHIAELEESEKKGIQIHSISNSEVIENKLKSISDKLYEIFRIKYSMGVSISELLADFDNFADAYHSVKEPRYYLHVINMLSVGILLDANARSFGKIVEVLKRNYPKERVRNFKFINDWLIDLLVNFRMPGIERTNKNFFREKPYAAFADIENVAKTDKVEAVKILKKYLQKQWLPSNNTNSRGKEYHSGYWSFESGAIVKILDLDDISLKHLDFYPYDMVHWRD
jgi:hypothetical protein